MNELREKKHPAPGMIISLDNRIYKIEACVKVTVKKGLPFIKTKLMDLLSYEEKEKNFKVDQKIFEVKPERHRLEYLYRKENKYYFMDIDTVDVIPLADEIPERVIRYLKLGVILTASLYQGSVFAIELPSFLELGVVKIEDLDASDIMSSSNRMAVLETGAKVIVPIFIEVGDVIQVETKDNSFVRRL